MAFLLAYISLLAQVLIYVIIAWSLLSWFPLRGDHPARVILGHIAQPLLSPLRRSIPRLGMLDLTPVVAILILIAIRYILSSLL